MKMFYLIGKIQKQETRRENAHVNTTAVLERVHEPLCQGKYIG